MKRHGCLWGQVIDFENIELAYQKAKRGKAKYRQVQEIENNSVFFLKELQKSLIDETFTTSTYKTKKIHEPKERDIYVLPFYPDRIVQHALMNVVAPIWDKLFIFDTYACRPGKGQHKASLRVMNFISKKHKYYFQGDIKKFYPSINHEILYTIITNKIKDKKVLRLFKNIITSIVGDKNVPIGNLTSQWLGNLYLNELDTYIKNTLKIKNYLRYNDDFILFGNNKKVLKDIQEDVRLFLKEKLNLTLSKEKIQSIENGIDFVGYRHFPNKILLRKASAKRMKRNLNIKHYKFIKGHTKPDQFISTIQSIRGWLKWANTYNFQQALKLDSLLQEAENAKLSKIY